MPSRDKQGRLPALSQEQHRSSQKLSGQNIPSRQPHQASRRSRATHATSPTAATKCHSGRTGKTCHEKQRPASHANDWRHKHKELAKKKDATCSSCHKEKFCLGCHRTEIPHPDNWKGPAHGQRAVKDASICGTCHKKEFCRDCPHKSNGRSGPHKECRTCHEPGNWKFRGRSETCDKCHKNKHTDGAPEKHRECIGCHKPHTWKPGPVPELCATCHQEQYKAVKHNPAMSIAPSATTRTSGNSPAPTRASAVMMMLARKSASTTS